MKSWKMVWEMSGIMEGEVKGRMNEVVEGGVVDEWHNGGRVTKGWWKSARVVELGVGG